MCVPEGVDYQGRLWLGVGMGVLSVGEAHPSSRPFPPGGVFSALLVKRTNRADSFTWRTSPLVSDDSHLQGLPLQDHVLPSLSSQTRIP